MSASVSPASRRRSEWPRITQAASPASIGAEISPVYAPDGLVVDVLRTDLDPLVRDRAADGLKGEERRADDADDAGLARGGRDRGGQLARVGGGGVHLPVGGDDDGSHAHIMPSLVGRRPGGTDQSRRSVAPAERPSSCSGRRLDPSPAPVHGRPVQPQLRRELRRASPPGSARLASATRRVPGGRSSRRPSRSSRPIAATWRADAATARWRFADSALITRFSSPRSARATWRASSSSNDGPAPMVRRNVTIGVDALPRQHAAPSSHPHGRREPDRREPPGQLCRTVRVHHELEVRARRRRG